MCPVNGDLKNKITNKCELTVCCACGWIVRSANILWNMIVSHFDIDSIPGVIELNKSGVSRFLCVQIFCLHH